MAMSASLKAVPWNRPMGCPNAVRVFAHCAAIFMARSASPMQFAASMTRPEKIQLLAMPKPFPSPPRMLRAGTRTSVKEMMQDFMPRFETTSSGVTSMPGVSLSTRNAVMRLLSPFGVFSTPVTANRMMKSARIAMVMNCFVPLMTKSSPSRTARVVMARASEPVPGSVSAKHSQRSPVITGFR